LDKKGKRIKTGKLEKQTRKKQKKAEQQIKFINSKTK